MVSEVDILGTEKKYGEETKPLRKKKKLNYAAMKAVQNTTRSRRNSKKLMAGIRSNEGYSEEDS